MPTDTTRLERRENIRFPPQVRTVSLRAESTASVVDESHGGIALDLFASPLAIGQTVQVLYDGAAMPAEIIHIEPIENGSRLGLRWL